MRSAWTSVSVAVLALALAAPTLATDLEDRVRQTITDFQEMMPTGRADLGIPVLEPASIALLPLKVKASPFDAKVVASDILVAGASGFQLTQLSQVGDSNQVRVSVELPRVDVTGQYDIDGKVKVGFVKIKLGGHGPLTLAALGIKGEGVAEVRISADGSLHVDDLKIESWSYDKLEINLGNLFNGGVMGKTVNKIINSIVPSVIKSNGALITGLMETMGKKFINKYLDGAGRKLSFVEKDTAEWYVSGEVQQMLDQLALIVAAAPGASVTDDSDSQTDLETQAAELLENFREVMKTGNPDFDLPVMDPAVIEKLSIKAKHGPFNARIVTSNSSIAGVSSFVVNKIAHVEESNKLAVEIEIPALDIAGDYTMDGKIKLLITHLIKAEGSYGLSAQNVKLSATATVDQKDDGSFNLADVTVTGWTFGSIHVQFDDMLKSYAFNTAANIAINQILPILVENHRRQINAWIQNVAKIVLNKYLDGMSGTKVDPVDLEALIRQTSESFRTVMKTGAQDFGIAVMDPIALPQLPVHVHKWLLDGQVVASEMVLSGASDFVLTDVTEMVGTNKVSLAFEVPTLTLTASYDLATKLNVAISTFNMHRNGAVSMVATGVKATTTAEISLDSNGALVIDSLQVESWNYDNLAVEVDNLAHGGFLKSKVNMLINKLVSSLLVKPHVEDMSTWVSRSSLRAVSRFLDAVAGRVAMTGLDKRTAELLEDLRPVMQAGSADFGMPVLDPFVLQTVPFTFVGNVITASITAENMQLQGTSAFSVKRVEQIAGRNEVAVEIEVPQIDGGGNFELTGGLKWPNKKITDKGSMTAMIRGLKVNATALLAEDIAGALTLKTLNIESWTFDEVSVQFKNLKDSHVGILLNSAINAALPAIINSQHDLINDWAQSTATLVLDQFLAGEAAKAAAPVALHITAIPAEARAVLRELAFIAVQSGAAVAA